jgi:hypothetical protein
MWATIGLSHIVGGIAHPKWIELEVLYDIAIPFALNDLEHPAEQDCRAVVVAGKHAERRILRQRREPLLDEPANCVIAVAGVEEGVPPPA